MKKFRAFGFGFVSFLIVYLIFFTMNDEVAQLVFFWGLSIIGCYIYKLCHFIFNKVNNIINKKEQSDEKS